MPRVAAVDDGMDLAPAERVGVSQYPPAEWLPRLKADRRGQVWATPVGTADMPVVARVNHGRWIADCQFCNGAAWVTPRDPRFWCVDCDNQAVAGRWVPVRFPDEVTRLEGERVLAVRPAHQQNWWPERESTVDLMGENVTVLNLPPYEGW